MLPSATMNPDTNPIIMVINKNSAIYFPRSLRSSLGIRFIRGFFFFALSFLNMSATLVCRFVLPFRSAAAGVYQSSSAAGVFCVFLYSSRICPSRRMIT